MSRTEYAKPDARLTPEEVVEIRERFAANGALTKQALADEYGCTEQNIRKIVTGDSWQEVPGPRTETQEQWAPRGKLSYAEAWEIRSEYENTDKTQQEIADDHEKDISQMTVSRIVNHESWKGMPDE